MSRREIFGDRHPLAWVLLCLLFRFYPYMPRAWQIWFFDEVTGPCFRFMNQALKGVLPGPWREDIDASVEPR